MSVSAAIRKLIDAGMPIEQALMAAEAFEEALTPKRSAGAERTRRWRENKKAAEKASQNVTSVTPSQASQNVTCDGRPTEPLPSSLLPSEEKKEVRSLRSLCARDADAFTRFWRAYPNRPGNPRAPAQRAFSKAIERGAAADELIDAAEALAVAMVGVEPRFIPHATTWLNQDRYRDGPPPMTISNQARKTDVLSEACDAVIQAAEDADRRASYGDGETGQVLDWPVQRLPGFC